MFTVALSPPSGQTATVSYATANGTALAGEDYVPNSNTLIFAPGETTKTIAIAVKGDTLSERNETFFVDLSDAMNATMSKARGVCTIVNDDR